MINYYDRHFNTMIGQLSHYNLMVTFFVRLNPENINQIWTEKDFNWTLK